MSTSGVILVVVGAALLANNFGMLQLAWLHQWWPVILIAVGIWSILRPQRGDRRSRRDVDRLP